MVFTPIYFFLIMICTSFFSISSQEKLSSKWDVVLGYLIASHIWPGNGLSLSLDIGTITKGTINHMRELAAQLRIFNKSNGWQDYYFFTVSLHSSRSAGEFNNKAIPTSLDIAKPSALKLHLTSINHTQIVAYSLCYTASVY